MRWSLEWLRHRIRTILNIAQQLQWVLQVHWMHTCWKKWKKKKNHWKWINEYLVRLWLAPGTNIHRSPLCGRNKENFSEDPVFSASCSYFKMKGFQSFPELGVTLKHFFFNSQEDNCFFVNENIHERSFREI